LCQGHLALALNNAKFYLASAVLMEGIGFALHIISELIFEKFLPYLSYDGKA
jgi:hypothetical protein